MDLGGVYFSDGTNIAFEKMNSVIKVQVPRERLEQLFHGKQGFLGGLFYRGKIEPEEFWKKVAQELKINLSNTRKLREIWYSSYTPNKRMKELVLKLGKKYKLIIFSGNTKERVKYLDEKYEFKQYFDDFVFSFDVGGTKKESIFYEALIKTLSKLDVQPEEAILIDDKEKALETAKSFGFKTILFKDAGQLEQDINKLGINVV